MTLKLEISRELEKELSTEASKLGLPLSDYALRVLSNRQVPVVMPKTGAELVAYWQAEGLIGTRPEISDSVEHARALRRKAEKRARA
jgi:hypothetical protein